MDQSLEETHAVDLIPKHLFREFEIKEAKRETMDCIDSGENAREFDINKNVPACRLVSIKCFLALLTFLLLLMTLLTNFILDLTSNTALVKTLEKYVNQKMRNKTCFD